MTHTQASPLPLDEKALEAAVDATVLAFNTRPDEATEGRLKAASDDEQKRIVAEHLAPQVLRAYLTALSSNPSDEGWIEWKGGKMPVSGGSFVDVKFRNGTEGVRMLAHILERGKSWWVHEGRGHDIIAYRVVT